MLKEWVIKAPAREGIREFNYEQDLFDPFLLKDMDKAVKRLLKAVEKNEKIMIFADYDADGVPGAAVLATFFKKIGYQNFTVYLPDRHLEDYGLSQVVVDQAKADKVKLILTIDCGIANAKEVAYAKKLGIETIVTDHHLVPEEMPKAVAVVDPKREDCQYPYKHLCGAGVVFKLVQALASQKETFLGSSEANPCLPAGRPRTQEKSPSAPFPTGWEKWLLDLVAIATVSDMVPLTGENRALAHFGLKVLRKSPRPGIVELCRALRIKQEFLTEDDIAFSIGPRINAASRMAHAREAFELLTTEDVAVAATIANRLEKLNKERKKCVDEILAAVNASQQETFLGSSETIPRTQEKSLAASLVVIGHESWSLGVLGLTASRLVETYRRPVFIWGKNGNGVIKGSCRSDGSVNVVELMRAANTDNFFLNIGGHHHAGGFSLVAERVGELEERLLTAWATLPQEVVEEKLMLDGEMELEQITPQFYRELEKLSPFGIENPKPIFLLRGVEIAGIRKFGGNNSHLELEIRNSPKAISFFNTFPNLNLQPGQRLDLAASIEFSHFSYPAELRLRIVDLRPAR